MKVASRAVAIAAAVLGAGVLAAPVPTVARPPLRMAPACQVWKLQGNVLSMTTSDGSKARFDWDPGSQKPTSGTLSSGGTQWTDIYISGKAQGTTVDWTVAWKEAAGGFGGGEPGFTGTYTDMFKGTINPDGQVTGTRLDNASNSTKWLADQRFTCTQQAAATPSTKPTRAVGKPIDPNAPKPKPPPVTGAIKLSFAPPTTFSITATIENSSTLKAECTYDASPLGEHRDFTVEPKSSTNLVIEGFRTFTTYHVVVSCHDASGGQAEEIGHAETDVVF